MLDAIGIEAQHEAVYEALVAQQLAGATELATTTEIPVHRVRASLRALERLGLTSRAPGTRSRHIVVDPAIALEVLLLEDEQRLKRARIRAQELAERFHRVAAERDPAELVEVVTGRQTILQRVEQAVRGVHHQLRAFDKPPYARDAVAPNEDELDLLRRGGIARTLYERAAVDLPGRLADLEQGVAAGEQARVLPRLPMKLFLIDDRFAIVPLQAAPAAIESVVIVHQSALLEALSALFETLWELALPLDLAAADPSLLEGPSEEERRILALLTAGLPDEAIARHIGLSSRTYQRRIRDMMDRLHVQTRFQLALQATRRGWLEDLLGQGVGLTT